MHDRLRGTLADAALWVIAAWLLALPLALPWLSDHTVHDSARLSQAMLAALCALAILPAAARLRVRWPTSLLIGAGAIAFLGADRLDMAWREAALGAGMVAVALVVATATSRRPLGWAVAAATALYAILVLLVALLAGADAATVQHAELVFGYANRRHFNHVQTVAFPLCVWLAATAEQRQLRRLAALAAACTLSLLVMTLGRATILALVIGFGVTAFVARPTAALLWRPAAWSVGAGLVIYGLVFHLWPTAFGHAPSASADMSIGHLAGDQSRLALWRWAFDAWREAPWFGIGPMHLSQRFNGIAGHAHSLPLQMLAEWGLVFTLIAAALLWRFVRRLAAASAASIEVTALLWGVVAIAVDSLVSGNAVMPVSQVWIAVAFGWAARALRDAHPPRAADAGSAWTRRITTGVVCVVLLLPVGLAVAVLQEWPTLPAQIEAALKQFPSPAHDPRFWSHGWF